MTRPFNATNLAGVPGSGSLPVASPAAGAAHSPAPAADFSPQARAGEPHATADQIVRMDTNAEVHRVLLGRLIREVYGCKPWELHEDEAERLCDPATFAAAVAEWQGEVLVSETERLRARVKVLEAALAGLRDDAEMLEGRYATVAREMGRVMRRRCEEVLG